MRNVIRFIFVSVVLTGCGASPDASPKSQDVVFDDIPSNVAGAFLMLPNCGAIKINADRPLYLSALHCFQDDESVQATRTETIQLGDLVNYEWVVRYGSDLEELGFAGSRRVIASGREWTGFALDVLKTETEEHVAWARQAVASDWVIFEDPTAPNAGTHACLGVATVPVAGDATVAYGRHAKADVMDAEAGEAVAADFMDDRRYPYTDQWTPTMRAAMLGLLTSSEFIVTDADVHPGMSGGPVVDANGLLVGISTVKLEPNFCTLADEDCDKPFHATHGAVSVEGIRVARPDVADLFVCDL